MKVCMISGAYPDMTCGIGDFTSMLVRHLAAHNIEVDVLARRDPRVLSGREGSVTVSPILSAMPLADVPVIGRHVEQANCDLIHIQYPTWPYRRSLGIAALPMALRLLTRKPVVVSFHEASMCHPLNKLRLLPTAWGASLAIATTAEDSFWLASRIPGLAGRIHHIPIGSNVISDSACTFDRQSFRRKHGITTDETVVCYFGFAFRNKLLENLLPAFRIALNWGVRLRPVFLTGFEQAEGSYGKLIRNLIGQLGLGQHMIQTGYLPKEGVSHWLQAADAATLLFADGASLRRGSILAAMVHGLPVISTNPANEESALRPNENILCCEKADFAGIARHITRLAANPSLRRKLSEASFRMARNFEWSEIAAETAEVYEQLLSTSRTKRR